MALAVSTSTEVYTWPIGFGAVLPQDHWQVAHALPRQDKRLAEDLARRRIAGLTFYENRARTYLKSTQHFQVPLLGGYLFVHVPRERRHEIFDTGRVVRIIDVADPLRLAADLEALRKLLDAAGDAPVMVMPELVPGRMVHIRSGSFIGCKGVIVRRKENVHLVVNLPILGQSVATVIPLATAELHQE
jgi:transcription antitermination factor NusG